MRKMIKTAWFVTTILIIATSSANAQFAQVTCPPSPVVNNSAINPALGVNYGVLVNGYCASVINTNAINSNINPNVFGLDAAVGINSAGSLASLENTGTIRGINDNFAVSIANGGKANIKNDLNILSEREAIYNNSGMLFLTNNSSGVIASKYIAIGSYNVGGSGIINFIKNSGRIQIENQSGPNAAAIYNENQIQLVNNSGIIRGGAGAWATIYNTGSGYTQLILNSGSISSRTTTDTAIQFGSNASQSSILTNTGAISGNVLSGAMGGVTINQKAGTIAGNINLAAASSVINMSGGSISGSIDLSGSSANIVNFYSGTIIGNLNFNGASANELNIRTNDTLIVGNITNTIANQLTMNVDGAFITDGNIGTAAAPINTLNINANGEFIHDAGNNVYATNTNINYDGIYAPIANNVTINSNVNVNQGGMFAVYDSGWTSNINGKLTMASGSAAFIPIGLATASDYGKIVSNQPLNIANGAFIVATLDPTQTPAVGTVLHGVIQGNGAPIQAGQIVVLNSNARYQFQAKWDGNEVDLVLPRKTAAYTAVFGSNCSGSSVNLSGVLGNFSGYSPGCGGTDGTGGVYDGALAQQTLQSISAVKGPTEGLMHQRYAVLNAVMEYDCKTFDKNNFCISAQARATGFGSQATGAGVFNIAYRPIDQVRIGGFLDYQVTAGSPVMNSIYGAGALYSGNVLSGYDNPTFGGYIGFSQSGYTNRILNTGVQAFVSGGYNPGKVSVTRAMMLDPYGTGFVDSQPGMGTASLNSYFYRGLVGYGIGLTDQLTFMPYGGMRITDVTRGGYMEGYNSVVQQPLVFNAYGEHLFTGFGGGMLNGQLTDRLGALIGLGAETDISRTADSFGGYSPIQIERMTTFGFQHGGSYNGIRPTGSLGAYYDIAKNQRIMINGYAGQQAWTSRAFTTGLLGYQVAF